MGALSLEELASQAEVDAEYVRQLAELGAFEPQATSDGYGPADVRPVHFLRMWEAAGYKGVADLVRVGKLAVSWFDAPVMTRSEHLDITYADLCRNEGIPIALGRAIQEALGLAPSDPDDHARGGDPDLFALVANFLSVGVSEASILSMVRVYADNLRRVALAEAELYESAIEEPLRRSGMSTKSLSTVRRSQTRLSLGSSRLSSTQAPAFGQVPAVMSHPPLASGATATVPGATLFPEQSSNQ